MSGPRNDGGVSLHSEIRKYFCTLLCTLVVSLPCVSFVCLTSHPVALRLLPDETRNRVVPISGSGDEEE